MAEESRKKEKLIIIGGGPAGLSAAIYAARGGLDPLVINGPEPGGQITTTSELENYPGFPGGIGGFDLMQKVTEQAESFDARLVYEIVESVDFSGDSYIIKTDMEEYEADSVIIATGAEPRKLGLEKEDKFRGNGISYCATCDAAFFKDQDVAIVGGGDTSLWEATFLTKFASRVYVIHRRDEFRGTKILGDRVKNNEKIEILWDTEIKELLGENKLQGIKIFNNENGDERDLGVSGLFIAVGHTPRTELFKDEIELDEKGYIVTDREQKTNIEGVYAAGDVQDPEYRQVITASASGAKAAIQAGKYIDNKN
ncbi:MAG: thioredoxin-disulfide reductase [Bacillota bacterium]